MIQQMHHCLHNKCPTFLDPTTIITPYFYLQSSSTPSSLLPVMMKMKMKMPHYYYSLCAMLLLVISGTTVVTATDHIVGANRGWNPGMNYTLWANNHTFYVGDLISFRYQRTQYNVFEVNQTGYDNCTTDSAVGNWSSGKDFIPLNKAKRYYFICGNGQCFNGMKVSVLVHPLPPPPSAAVAAEHSTKSASPPPVLLDWGLYSLMVSIVLHFYFALDRIGLD